jgi:hypothetical protein
MFVVHRPFCNLEENYFVRRSCKVDFKERH